MFLLVFGVGGAAGDQLAERLVTDRAEASLVSHGVVNPQLDVAGFPFLTQLVRGEFTEVSLRASSVRAGEAAATRIRATGSGVARPAGDQVSVEWLTASGVVAYEDVLRRAGLDDLRLEAAGPRRVRLGGEVDVLGQAVEVSVLSRLRLHGRTLSLVPYRVEAAGLPSTVSAGLTDRFRLSYRISDLPPGLRLRDVRTTEDGFLVRVGGENLSLTGLR